LALSLRWLSAPLPPTIPPGDHCMEMPATEGVQFRPFDDFSPADRDRIEARTQQIGRELFDQLRASRPGLLERRWWDDRIMGWSMSDEALKVELFRFVDVLPMLGTSQAVNDHLVEHLERVGDRLPSS